MSIMRMIADGSFIPDPDTYPTDLVTVVDVYGRRHRVRQKHLDDGRSMLSRFNQYGVHILGGKMLLRRENIKPDSVASAGPRSGPVKTLKPPSPIDIVKRDLPDITVRVSGRVLPAIVRGRTLPFAQVSWADGGHCEAAWATIARCVTTGSPLRAD